METLTDLPWWLPTMLIVIGGYLAYNGNRKQDAKMRGIGGAVLVLAVGLMLVSYFLDSPMETVSKRSKQLVESVVKRDWQTMSSLLEKDASLLVYQGRDNIVAGAKASVDVVGLKSAYVLSVVAEPRGPRSFQVQMSCLSDQDRTGRATQTNWELVWVQTAEGWLVSEIRPLGGAGASPEDIGREMVRTR